MSLRPAWSPLLVVFAVGCDLDPPAERPLQTEVVAGIRSQLVKTFKNTECHPILEAAGLRGQAYADDGLEDGRVVCRADFRCVYNSACVNGYREKSGKACPQNVEIVNRRSRIGTHPAEDGKSANEACREHFKSARYDLATYNCAAAIYDPDKRGASDPDSLPTGRDRVCEPDVAR